MAKNHPSLVAMSTAGLALLASACLGDSSGTPPVITVQPADQVAAPGLTATFTVDATGTGSLSCQWAVDGAFIDGATSWTYTTPAVTLADAGTVYAATVRDQGGAPVVSRGARLRVEGPIATGSLARARGGHAELYDPAAGTWTLRQPEWLSVIAPSATLLPSGSVLLAGGYDRHAGARSTALLWVRAP